MLYENGGMSKIVSHSFLVLTKLNPLLTQSEFC